MPLLLCFWIMDLCSRKPNPSFRSLKDTPNPSPPPLPISTFFLFDTGKALPFFLYRIPHALQSDWHHTSQIDRSALPRSKNNTRSKRG